MRKLLRWLEFQLSRNSRNSRPAMYIVFLERYKTKLFFVCARIYFLDGL